MDPTQKVRLVGVTGEVERASSAQVFLDERTPELAGVVKLDPEGSMFSACSDDETALR